MASESPFCKCKDFQCAQLENEYNSSFQKTTSQPQTDEKDFTDHSLASPLWTNRRRPRSIISRSQFVCLWDEFCQHPFPNKAKVRSLATQLKLDYRTVRVWFQNRRCLERRNGRNVSQDRFGSPNGCSETASMPGLETSLNGSAPPQSCLSKAILDRSEISVGNADVVCSSEKTTGAIGSNTTASATQATSDTGVWSPYEDKTKTLWHHLDNNSARSNDLIVDMPGLIPVQQTEKKFSGKRPCSKERVLDNVRSVSNSRSDDVCNPAPETTASHNVPGTRLAGGCTSPESQIHLSMLQHSKITSPPGRVSVPSETSKKSTWLPRIGKRTPGWSGPIKARSVMRQDLNKHRSDVELQAVVVQSTVSKVINKCMKFSINFGY